MAELIAAAIDLDGVGCEIRTEGGVVLLEGVTVEALSAADAWFY
jgi:hypothetical protein